jgi:hypothetical protein
VPVPVPAVHSPWITVTGPGSPSWKANRPGGDAEVDTALDDGLVVVLNDQTEGACRRSCTTRRRRGWGLLAWTLTPGMLAACADLADPTVIRSDWACADTGLE